ncbi:hypothetical protein GC209_02580 [bacterium]|nr:hypothetical protein [bacterium]
MTRQKYGRLLAGLVTVGVCGFAPALWAQDQTTVVPDTVAATAAAAVPVPAAAPDPAGVPAVASSPDIAVAAAPAEPSTDPAFAGIPGDASALGGYDVLIADRGNNRLLLVSPEKQILWQYDFPGLPKGNGADDAFFADDGQSIITNLEHQQVIEVIDRATKAVTWSYGTLGHKGAKGALLDYPDDAYKVANGNIVVADIRNCRILEIAPDKHIVRQAGKTGQCASGPGLLPSPNGDKPLPNGHLLVSTINDHSLVELDETWTEVNRLSLPFKYPSDPQLTAAGNYLVAGYTNPGALMELAHDGTPVWTYQPQADGVLNKPSLAIELPNGNVMVTDDLNARVVVIDKASNKIVWQYGVTRHPGSAPGYVHIPDGLDIIKAE